MKKPDCLYLTFSREEFTNSKIRAIIKELINSKFILQRYHDFIQVSPMEFELIQEVFRGEFIDKSKYGNATNFKNEIGKMRGKRIIVE